MSLQPRDRCCRLLALSQQSARCRPRLCEPRLWHRSCIPPASQPALEQDADGRLHCTVVIASRTARQDRHAASRDPWPSALRSSPVCWMFQAYVTHAASPRRSCCCCWPESPAQPYLKMSHGHEAYKPPEWQPRTTPDSAKSIEVVGKKIMYLSRQRACETAEAGIVSLAQCKQPGKPRHTALLQAPCKLFSRVSRLPVRRAPRRPHPPPPRRRRSRPAETTPAAPARATVAGPA